MADNLEELSWQLTSQVGDSARARENAARILKRGDLVILYFNERHSSIILAGSLCVLIESIDATFLRGKSLKERNSKDVSLEYKTYVEINGMQAYLDRISILARDVDFNGELVRFLGRLLGQNDSRRRLINSISGLIKRSEI